MSQRVIDKVFYWTPGVHFYEEGDQRAKTEQFLTDCTTACFRPNARWVYQSPENVELMLEWAQRLNLDHYLNHSPGYQFIGTRVPMKNITSRQLADEVEQLRSECKRLQVLGVEATDLFQDSENVIVPLTEDREVDETQYRRWVAWHRDLSNAVAETYPNINVHYYGDINPHYAPSVEEMDHPNYRSSGASAYYPLQPRINRDRFMQAWHRSTGRNLWKRYATGLYYALGSAGYDPRGVKVGTRMPWAWQFPKSDYVNILKKTRQFCNYLAYDVDEDGYFGREVRNLSWVYLYPQPWDPRANPDMFDQCWAIFKEVVLGAIRAVEPIDPVEPIDELPTEHADDVPIGVKQPIKL